MAPLSAVEQDHVSVPRTSGRATRTRLSLRRAGVSLRTLFVLIAVISVILAIARYYPPRKIVSAVFGQPHVEAWLRIDHVRLSSLDPFGQPAPPPTDLEFKRFVRTQQATIKSPIVLARVLADPNVSKLPLVQGQPDAFAWLQSELHVESPHDSNLLKIWMNAESQDAVTVLDQVMKAYMEVVYAEHRAKSSGDYDTTVRNAEQIRNDIIKAQDNNTRLAKLLHGHRMDTTRPIELVQDRVNGLEAQLAQIDDKRLAVLLERDAKRERTKAAEAWSAPKYLVERELGSDPELVELRAQLVDLETQAAAAPSDALTHRVAEQYAEIEKRSGLLRPSIEAELKARAVGDPLAAPAVFDAQLATIGAARQEVEQQLAAARKELDRYSIISPELRQSNTKVELLERTYKDLMIRINRMRIELQSAPRIELVQGATLVN